MIERNEVFGPLLAFVAVGHSVHFATRGLASGGGVADYAHRGGDEADMRRIVGADEFGLRGPVARDALVPNKTVKVIVVVEFC